MTKQFILFLLVCGCVSTTAMSGCQFSDDTPEPETNRLIDLVEAFPTSQLAVSTPLVDVGEERARELLLHGWSVDEERRASDGTRVSFAWSTVNRSTMLLGVTGTPPSYLHLRGWAMIPREQNTQEVTFALNGKEIHRIRATDTPDINSIELDPDLVKSGWNILEIGCAQPVRPARDRPQNKDIRRLCYALDWVVQSNHATIHETSGADRMTWQTPQARPQDGVLNIPAGTQVSYFLRELPPNATLRAESIERVETQTASPSSRLHVRLTKARSRGADEDRSGTPVSSDLVIYPRSDLRQPLPPITGGPVRISLTVENSGNPQDLAKKQHTGLRLHDPVIEASDRQRIPSHSRQRTSSPRRRPPNILVYMIDTLRSDVLGSYGNTKGLTPHLDAIAEQGFVFEHAIASSSWTRPSAATIFSGLQPTSHGVNRPDQKLAKTTPLLTELLRDAGYNTGGIITNGHLSPPVGFDRGFEHYEYLPESTDRPDIHVRGETAHREALTWLDSRSQSSEDEDQPFFLYVHVTDPHYPYLVPDDLRDRFAPGRNLDDLHPSTLNPINPHHHPDITLEPNVVEDLRRLYEAEVAETDRYFGEFVAALKERELWDSTFVVVLSDHGEEFAEHGGLEHGLTLYQEVLRVPLIVKPARSHAGPTGIRPTVSHVDIAPTIMEVAGISGSDGMDGKSLTTHFEREGNPSPDEAHAVPMHAFLDKTRRLYTVQMSNLKTYCHVAETRQARSCDLFDLSEDPAETTDVSDELPVWAGYLGTLAARALNEGTRGGTDMSQQPDELQDRFKALGYIQ